MLSVISLFATLCVSQAADVRTHAKRATDVVAEPIEPGWRLVVALLVVNVDDDNSGEDGQGSVNGRQQVVHTKQRKRIGGLRQRGEDKGREDSEGKEDGHAQTHLLVCLGRQPEDDCRHETEYNNGSDDIDDAVEGLATEVHIELDIVTAHSVALHRFRANQLPQRVLAIQRQQQGRMTDGA